MGLVLAFYLRNVGSIPAHSTKGSKGCISGDRMSILGVVRIPHKSCRSRFRSVVPLLSRQIGNVKPHLRADLMARASKMCWLHTTTTREETNEPLFF